MILGAIVLAGGQSERMGRPKADLPWGDGSLLLHVVSVMESCTWPVIVVSRSEDAELPPLDPETEVVFDTTPGAGPLPAIETGMRLLHGRAEAAIVVACDMPFVDNEAVRWLFGQLGEHSAAIPEFDGQLHPLCAIYHLRLQSAIHDLVQGGERRAQALAELPGAHRIQESAIRSFRSDGGFLRDIDTEDDYRQALKDAGLD